MDNKSADKLFFLLVIFYLPFSIFFIFWLYLASIIFLPDTLYYGVFYGRAGNNALFWLFIVLLPAFLFLIIKVNEKTFISRLLGESGFYCLLGGLISKHNYLVSRFCFFINEYCNKQTYKK